MKLSPILSTLITLCAVSAASASSANFNGAFSDNFDEMGTGAAAPTGWTVESEAGTHYTFAPANGPVVSGDPAPGTNPNLTAGALTLEASLSGVTPGTQKGLGGYNFLATGATGVANDRALGTSPSGNAATILELSLTNTSGSPINTLSLSYDIDRFTTTSDTNNLGSTNPTDPYLGVEEFPGYWLFYSQDGGTTWTNVAALNPTLSGPSGVIVPNSTGLTSVTGASLTLGTAWAAGGNLQFAWLDDNAESPSPDQLIGLNNVAITAAPEPASATLLGFGALGILALRRRRNHS